MPKHGKDLIVDFGVVLFQCTRLQILRGVFLSPSVNKLTKGSFFSRKNQTVFYAVLKLDGKCLLCFMVEAPKAASQRKK